MNEDETQVEETTEEEVVTLTKAEYDKLNQTLGSLKREVKTFKKEAEAPQKSNEPDYARLAYLASQRVDHPDDQKIVMEEASRLQMPLTDVLNMEHIKARLQANQNQRTAEDGSPTGSGRKGGAGKGDVDYYLANPDEVPPDLKLHNEVIEARMKREQEDNLFSKVPFVG